MTNERLFPMQRGRGDEWRGPDRRRLEQLLADLDSEQFSVRRQARKELGQFGELAEPALRRLLAGKPSLEVRRQALALLERLETASASAESLRLSRAVIVLERIGDAPSVELLRRLAGGAAESRLTRDAAAALTRRTPRSAARVLPANGRRQSAGCVFASR